MRNWLQHIIEGNVYLGLEVFETGNQVFYALVKVKKKKGELHIVYENTFDALEEVSNEIQKNVLLFLTINTSKVLRKPVEMGSVSHLEQLVVQAFPNLELENFHYQSLDLPNGKMVFISKKDYVQQLLGQLGTLGISPFQIQLGIAPANQLVEYLDQPMADGSNFKLYKDGVLEPSDTLPSGKVKISELSMHANSILSFGQVLGHLRKAPIAASLASFNTHLKDGFKNHRVFNFGLRLALGTFLGLLLFNFLLFSHYQTKIQSLENAYGLEHQQVNNLRALEKRVALKEHKLKAILGAVNSKSSYFLDRIAKGTPSSVQMDQLIYQPTVKPVREAKIIELDKDNILISGVTQNKLEFAQWTDSLEQRDWVNHTEIISYEYLSKSKDQFAFKVYLDAIE